VTSGRHNFAMITHRRKSTKKTLYGISIFNFYCWNQFKVILLDCALRARNLPKFSATSDASWRHDR